MRLRYVDLPVESAFGLRPSDVVTLNDAVAFDLTAGEARLVDRDGRRLGTLANTPLDLLRSFLAALDGERSFGAVCAERPFAEHARFFHVFVETLLGGPFLLPAAVAALERQLPAVELLRFPAQSPYAMPREYWENSIAVRQALGPFYERLGDLAAFSKALRGLHRLATLGASGRNFYGGAGGIATVPGELRTSSIGNLFDVRRKWILREWLDALGVPVALAEGGSIVSSNGVPFVRIAAGGHECQHPYGRAGEELERQLNEVRAHLAEAWAAVGVGRERLLRHLALFHHAFAHAHPFANINNSLAMNVVNDLLQKAGIGVLPHLYFDRAAYFLQPEDYVRVFERGVEAHVVSAAVGRDRAATHALLGALARAPR